MIPCPECADGTLLESSVVMIGTRNGESFDVPVDGLRCDHCGFETLDSAQLAGFTQAVSDAYRRAHGLLTGAEIRDRRSRLGMTQSEFARHLGVGVASVKRWENGQLQEKGMDELIRLKTGLAEAHRNLMQVQQTLLEEWVLDQVILGPATCFDLGPQTPASVLNRAASSSDLSIFEEAARDMGCVPMAA